MEGLLFIGGKGTGSGIDLHSRHSLSAGGPPSASLRLWGLPWTRFSRRSLEHPLQSNGMFFIKTVGWSHSESLTRI